MKFSKRYFNANAHLFCEIFIVSFHAFQSQCRKAPNNYRDFQTLKISSQQQSQVYIFSKIKRKKKKNTLNSQLFLLFNPANVIVISHGCTVGWTSAALPLLLSQDQTPLVTGPLTNLQLSWVVCNCSIIILQSIFQIISLIRFCSC